MSSDGEPAQGKRDDADRRAGDRGDEE